MRSTCCETGLFHTPRATDWKPSPIGWGAHAEKTGVLPEQVGFELPRGSMRVERIPGSMNDDDLWLPTPTVMDATRHTTRAVWRPGENWRGVALVNAILDAGEIRITGTHTTGMSENELLGTPNCMDMLPPHADVERLRAGKGAGCRNLRDGIDCLPTPTSNEWNGGTIEPTRRAAMGHAVTVADWAEKSDDIGILPEARLFATPNCMDAIAPRDGAALERVLRRGDRDGSRRDSTGNLREDVMMDDVDMMPTPRAGDVKGRNQRNDQTCMTGAVEQGTRAIPVPGPYHGGLWGLDDGRGVRFGRFAVAVRRWERVSGRPAPCPTQATGGLRRWVEANAGDPTLFDPYWLARHAPWDAHPRVRLDQPMGQDARPLARNGSGALAHRPRVLAGLHGHGPGHPDPRDQAARQERARLLEGPVRGLPLPVRRPPVAALRGMDDGLGGRLGHGPADLAGYGRQSQEHAAARVGQRGRARPGGRRHRLGARHTRTARRMTDVLGIPV